jgi:hypothetical protein
MKRLAFVAALVAAFSVSASAQEGGSSTSGNNDAAVTPANRAATTGKHATSAGKASDSPDGALVRSNIAGAKKGSLLKSKSNGKTSKAPKRKASSGANASDVWEQELYVLDRLSNRAAGMDPMLLQQLIKKAEPAIIGM